MSEERRGAARHVLWIPVQIESGPDVRILAVSRDISVSGVLMIAGAQLEVGQHVQLTLQLPGEGEDRQVGGEIVRLERNEEDPEGLWRHRLAVQFDEAVEDLEPFFEKLEAKVTPG